MTDARMSINLPGHPKMKRVIRSLGDSGAWHVIKLFLWVAGNRPDGDLSGLTADDIELTIDWRGPPGAFVSELVAVRFLDETDAGYQVHDWEEHNPWAAGTEMRAEKAKFNAFCKHHGRDEAARRMPEYAKRMGIECSQHATSMDTAASSNAPSPSPSPSPSVELELSNDNSPPAVAGPVEVIAEVYHDLMTACESIRVWTPKRTKKVTAADKLAAKVCKQLGWDYSRRREQFWRAYFEQCQLDPWLRGDVANPNNPKWKQNLFVLIDEDRFGKIMDAALAAMGDE